MQKIREDRTCSSDDMIADRHTHTRTHTHTDTLITIISFHINQSLFVANEQASATTYELERRANDTSEHIRFYRAMLCIRGTSHGPVSVCPSVRPSFRHRSEFY